MAGGVQARVARRVSMRRDYTALIRVRCVRKYNNRCVNDQLKGMAGEKK